MYTRMSNTRRTIDGGGAGVAGRARRAVCAGRTGMKMKVVWAWQCVARKEWGGRRRRRQHTHAVPCTHRPPTPPRYSRTETGVKYYYCAPQRHLSRAIRVPVDLHPPTDSRFLNNGRRGGGSDDGVQTVCAFIRVFARARVSVCVCVRILSTDKTYRGRTHKRRRRWPFIHFDLEPSRSCFSHFCFSPHTAHPPRATPSLATFHGATVITMLLSLLLFSL